MATIGLSKPYYAIYKNSDTTVTYSGLAVLAKAVEFSMELDGDDNNILYADNGPAESAKQFSGGTMTITTDDILPEAGAAILGLTLQTVTNEDISTATPQEMVFGESQTIPYLGFGVVIKKQQNNIMKYMGLVLPKIQFSNPGISAITQGETIDWQTPELTATIMRDDTAAHNWCRYSLLDSEADAVAYITQLLGGKAA
nr:MAG TPA: tail tube protein [Caudoviricetes sp.]